MSTLRISKFVRAACFAFGFFALNGGFVHAATVPLDPNFGELGIMRLPFSNGPTVPWVLTSFANDRIIATALYKPGDPTDNFFIYQPNQEEVRLFRASSGAPISTFGKQGLVTDRFRSNCSAPPTLAEANDGTIYVGKAGGIGTFCNGSFAMVDRISSSGGSLSSGYSDADTNRPYAHTGLALMPDGRMLFGYVGTVFVNDPLTSKVTFVAIGDGKNEVTHEWRTDIPAQSSAASEARLIIRKSPKGGFVAALITTGQLKLFRLDDAGKPSDEWGANMPGAGLRPSLQTQPNQLLNLVVTDNGDFALAVVEAASTIDVYRFFEVAKGSITYTKTSTKIPLGSRVVGGFTRAAEFFGATSGGEGQPRSEITFYSNTLEYGTRNWSWTPPANTSTLPVSSLNLYSIAVLPDARSAVVSMELKSGTPADAILAKFDFSKAVQPVLVREFFNTTLNHYFVTGSVGEINAISRGDAGPGWSGTSLTFDAYENAQTAPVNAAPVCRFYGTPGKGPNSHFYTFEGLECEAVKKDPGWLYEGIAFYAIKPTASGCNAGELPVYRAYNNRFAQNDSNHRYSVNLATLQSMTGWTVEGVVFCSPNR